ncbi:hypothetical protein VPNG_07926 [Cytospora leucostoma]|uniref:Cutinase n=1 Tax=Cytospora leucostoma TaxID=1230097 RepID=A0A423WAT0_9PEZI|nr:hypothetical protein VPNG_07926 [Cytospora leucostoma]
MKARTLILPSLLTLLPAQATSLLARDYDCKTDCSNTTCPPATGAAHIIVSRASAEKPGTGRLGPVADAVVSACPGSDVVANPYPALLDGYVGSETAGIDNLTLIVREYRECCPEAGKLVLLGYSQGAQVTADFLCGRSEVGFPVAAVVLMGDPSFVEDVPWDRGNASNKSFFPRLDNIACLPVADKMISYCDAEDYFCDNGTSADALAIHLGYVEEYGAQAVEYIVDKIGECDGAGSSAWK